MKLVEIGGIEFYTDKNEDLDADVFTDNSLWLFTKDSLIDSDKLCSFEREIDFAEILKYAGKENFRPHEVTFSAEAEKAADILTSVEMHFQAAAKNNKKITARVSSLHGQFVLFGFSAFNALR